MTGKIKVALCLSGEARSSMFCFPYIYESFINLGPEYEVKVYIHTRKNYRAVPLYQPYGYILDSPKAGNIEKRYNISENDFSPKLKKNTEFLSHFSTQSNFITNQLIMLEGIYKSFKLSTQNHPPYDIYIRLRPDIITDSVINLNGIIKDILNQKYDLFIPEKDVIPDTLSTQNLSIEYSDQLAIGNFKSMEIYSNIIFHTLKLLNQTEKWNAETWIRAYLKDNNIKVNSYWLPFYLVRGIQAYTNRNFVEKDLMFLDQ